MANKKERKGIPQTLTDNPKVIKSMRAIQLAGWWAGFTGLLSLVLGTVLIIFLGSGSHADSDTIVGAIVVNTLANGWLLYSGLRLHKLKDGSAVTKLLLWLNILVPCVVLYLNGQASQSGDGSTGGLGIFGAIAIIISIIALFRAKPYKQWRQSNKPKEQVNDADTLKDPDSYAAALGVVAAKAANDLQNEYHLSDEQSTNLMVQIIGFCIIALMREFKSSSIPPFKSREFINEALKAMARMLKPDNYEEAYKLLNHNIGTLSKEYGSLPVSNANADSLKGTLLWEYSKLMNATMGKEKTELTTLMENVAVITSVNSAIDTKDIIKSLQYHY